jgi:hypothetical protein
VAETVIRNDRRTKSDTDSYPYAINNADRHTYSYTQCHTNSDTYCKCNSEPYTDSDVYAYSDPDSDANCHGNSYTKTRPDPKTSTDSTAPPKPAVSSASIAKTTNHDQQSCGKHEP